MQTTKELLPAINNLYDLGLTDEEILKLQTAFNFVSRLPSDLLETGSSSLNRLMYAVIKPTTYITTRYGRNTIYFDRLRSNADGKTLQPENHTYLSSLQKGYVYVTDSYSSDIKEDKSLFLFSGTLNNTNFADLQKLTFLVNSIKDSGAKTLIREVKTFALPNSAVDSLKSIIQNNLETFNRKHSETIDIDNPEEISSTLKMIKSVWPSMKITTEQLTTEHQRKLRDAGGLQMITLVGEFNNTRLFMFAGSDSSRSYYSRNDVAYKWNIIPHTHPAYNYCDVGRFIYHNFENRTSNNCMGQRIFYETPATIPSADVINEEWARGEYEGPELVSNQQANIIAKRYTQRLIREKSEKEAEQMLRDKTQEKIAAVKYPKKKLKINEVVYTKDYIKYQGQTLQISSGASDNWCHVLLTRLANAHGISSITFDHVVDYFNMLIAESDAVSGIIGEVNFNLENRSSMNTRGISSTRTYLNNTRINNKELEQCLERALCFTTQSEFDYFLKSVSKCSLFIHRYLQLGVDIRVRDNFDHTQVTMKFPLERRKGKNYLVLSDDEFRVTNTQKLLRLTKSHDMLQVINTLLSGDAVVGVQASDIKSIITAGKQAYIDAVQKSKALLKETEELFNIEEHNYDIGETSRRGYKISGKIRTYFVESNVDTDDHRSCGVYDFNTGNYICIIDKSTSQVGMDKLVNRIYALHNDTLVANQINTLK